MPGTKRRPDRLDKPAVGDIVHIRFLDHVENGDEPAFFEVFGRIIEAHQKWYRVGSWRYVNDIDRVRDDNKENENSYTIIRSTITYLKVLK